MPRQYKNYSKSSHKLSKKSTSNFTHYVDYGKCYNYVLYITNRPGLFDMNDAFMEAGGPC